MCTGRCHACDMFDYCWDKEGNPWDPPKSSWDRYLDSIDERHVDYEELKGRSEEDDIPF